MNQYPKITIVTPSFNQGQYIEETILSVLNQNYPNLEYIIIDGGSTDNSLEIIKKYEDKLAWWVSEADKGTYDAVQKGFNRGTGDIMAWLNSDDLYHPKSLFTVAEIFGNFTQVKWLQGSPTSFDEQGRTVAATPLRSWSKFDFYTGDFQFIQQESVFWRRDLWEKSGARFNAEVKLAGDFDLWLRFFRYEQLYVTQALIGGFRLRSSNQVSLNNMEAYLREANERLKTEPISSGDLEVINKLNKVIALETFISKFHFLKHETYLKRFKQKYFNYPPSIQFNRISQKFEFTLSL